MLVVPKKDNSPRRVIDFSLLNKFCKRSAEAILDTNRIATAVPVPGKDQEIFFSCLDAWNGYHSIPLDNSAKNFFGFLTEFVCIITTWLHKDSLEVVTIMWLSIMP